ncbi:MAG: hypothetical protein JSW55_01760 [Chloroflexota bacterium]|nr:MAG: hypothetical protein JSW55_01760 [Chloroflexota bacterium]
MWPDLFRRSRLIDQLNQGLEPGNKHLLVSAPAGYEIVLDAYLDDH